MTRKATSWEFDAANQLKGQAVEEIGILFPNANIFFDVIAANGTPEVRAKVGDTTPHPRDEVVGWLSELGVRVLESDPGNTPFDQLN